MGDNEKNFKNGSIYLSDCATENDFTFYLTG